MCYILIIELYSLSVNEMRSERNLKTEVITMLVD